MRHGGLDFARVKFFAFWGRSNFVGGLPWLSSKPELKIFADLELACVYALGPTGGQPLRIG